MTEQMSNISKWLITSSFFTPFSRPFTGYRWLCGFKELFVPHCPPTCLGGKPTLIKIFSGIILYSKNYTNRGRNYRPRIPAQNYTKLDKIRQKLYRSQQNSGPKKNNWTNLFIILAITVIVTTANSGSKRTSNILIIPAQLRDFPKKKETAAITRNTNFLGIITIIPSNKVTETG